MTGDITEVVSEQTNFLVLFKRGYFVTPDARKKKVPKDTNLLDFVNLLGHDVGLMKLKFL